MGRTQATPTLKSLRGDFHTRLTVGCMHLRGADVPNMADGSSSTSVKLAKGMVERLALSLRPEDLSPQAVGSAFAVAVREFLDSVFHRLLHIRPGEWTFSTSQGPEGIARFSQYAHLAAIELVLAERPELRASMGGDYLIKPDIVVSRKSISDAEINRPNSLIEPGGNLASLTPLRVANRAGAHEVLHATISEKWSMRSDRAQNTRTEALNVIRNRKGGAPRIVVVTMEPLPSRIASIAMGTGDIDCCYHAALPELLAAAQALGAGGSETDLLSMLVDGGRLRDISDLPFDLAT